MARGSSIAQPPPPAPDDAPPVPRQLLGHLRDGRLALFAGAGLSAQAGLPTWRTLIGEVVDATVAEAMQGPEADAELRAMLDAGKWLELADHCKEKLGPGGYARLVAQRLTDAGREVPQAHRLAARLPFAAWVTTNYDKLLERAYAAERGGLPKTLTHLDTEPLGRLLFDGAPFVLKAHGDLDRPESLVFTSRDYRDLIHANAAFEAAFGAILLTHSVLFVGYSLSDPDFNLLLDRQLLTFRGFVPERYALMSGVGKVEEDYLWRVCRIRVIPYPEGRHDAVERFFRRLCDQLSEAQPTLGVPAPPASAASAVVATPARAAAVVPGVPLVLALDWHEGAIRSTLREGATVLESALQPAARWSELVEASRRLSSGVDATSTYGAILAEMAGQAVAARLGTALRDRGQAALVLELSRQTEHAPWELLSIDGRALAELTPVCRAPVDVSDTARGLPAIGSPLCALVIGDTTAAGAPPECGPLQSLPGAAQEAREIAAALERSGTAKAHLLLGEDATLDAVAGAFTSLKPDIVHFAGHAWFDAHEAYAVLADARLTSSMLRPWLTRDPPALMFLNSHFTAFIPAGVEALGGGGSARVRGGLGGRDAFSEVAMFSGVGAFIGSFSGAIDDLGACNFALDFYRRVLGGASVAEAVRASRTGPTAMLFSVHGAGDLLLRPGAADGPRQAPGARGRARTSKTRKTAP